MHAMHIVKCIFFGQNQRKMAFNLNLFWEDIIHTNKEELMQSDTKSSNFYIDRDKMFSHSILVISSFFLRFR